ncbi:MAG: hypothetical protein AAB071_03520 [Bacteroidota bacterium]
MLRALLHNVPFTIRSSFRWSRGFYKEKNEQKENLFAERANEKFLIESALKLKQTYKLDFLYSHSSAERYLESLTYLDYLVQLFSTVKLPENISFLDVGVKNWAYVEGVYRFLEKHAEQFNLKGIELDAFRVYRNFYSRTDYARSFIQHLKHTSFECGDVMQHRSKYDIISCFLPFVFIEPTLAWGLPEKYFQPQKFIRHLFSLLKKDGILIIVNQGKDENDEQQKIFRECFSDDELEIEWNGQMRESFFLYKYQRFGWRCSKKIV